MKTAEEWDEELKQMDCTLPEFVRAVQWDALEAAARLCDERIVKRGSVSAADAMCNITVLEIGRAIRAIPTPPLTMRGGVE